MFAFIRRPIGLALQALMFRDAAEKGDCCPTTVQVLRTCWDPRVLSCSQIWSIRSSSYDSLSNTLCFVFIYSRLLLKIVPNNVNYYNEINFILLLF